MKSQKSKSLGCIFLILSSICPLLGFILYNIDDIEHLALHFETYFHIVPMPLAVCFCFILPVLAAVFLIKGLFTANKKAWATGTIIKLLVVLSYILTATSKSFLLIIASYTDTDTMIHNIIILAVVYSIIILIGSFLPSIKKPDTLGSITGSIGFITGLIVQFVCDFDHVAGPEYYLGISMAFYGIGILFSGFAFSKPEPIVSLAQNEHSMIENLTNLKTLLDKEIITKEEFENKKRELMQ